MTLLLTWSRIGIRFNRMFDISLTMPINSVRMKYDSSLLMNQETNEQKLNGDLKLDKVW